MENRAAALAQALLAARQGGRSDAGFSEPSDLHEAMAAQALVAKAQDDPAGGWKVAVHGEFGPVLAPLHKSLILSSPARWRLGERLALELEVAVRLGRDLQPGDADQGRLRSAIDKVMVGVELVRRRVPSDAPFLLVLADHLANDGYVKGEDLDPQWLDAAGDSLRQRRCRLSQSGSILYDAPLARDAATLLKPLAANASAGFRAGEIVTLGSVCGLIPVASPGEVMASIEGLGELTFILEPTA